MKLLYVTYMVELSDGLMYPGNAMLETSDIISDIYDIVSIEILVAHGRTSIGSVWIMNWIWLPSAPQGAQRSL